MQFSNFAHSHITCILWEKKTDHTSLSINWIKAYVYFSVIVKLDPAVREAFDVAYDNIYAFHAAQRIPEKEIENMKVRIRH